MIWREGIGCEDTNLGAFLVLSNGDYVIKDQQSAARMHILAYFYIISLEGRLGSKRIFKEHGCRTWVQNVIAGQTTSPGLDFLQLSSFFFKSAGLIAELFLSKSES